MTLHKNEWIFEIHTCYVKLFLFSMWYNRLFISIFQFDFSLIKIFHCVNYWNVFAVRNRDCNIDLNWHEICIADYYFVQFANVHHCTFFFDWFFVFNDDFSDYKHRILKKNEIFRSFHIFLLMQFVKLLVSLRWPNPYLYDHIFSW